MDSFLNPKTIAVIGASENPEKVGYSLMNNLSNFRGKVIPINNKHKLIFGIKSYPGVEDYGGKIDLAIIAIPSEFVFEAVKECARKKIKNIILISAGFSEIGNTQSEKQLISFAGKHHIRILGPNCFGVCNPYIYLDTTFAKISPEKGNIAFISQSGALWSYISDFAYGKFGFSGFVSLGNMADISFNETLNYFSKDKHTKSIVLYVEKLKDGKKFIESCKKCKKPIYVVKAGESKKGSEAALSHTGSLATDFEIYKGAFRQAGIIQCDSLIECFEKINHKNYSEKMDLAKFGKKAVILTNAGGAGAIISDICFRNNIELVDWEEKNPYDLLGTANAESYSAAMNRLNGKRFYDFVILVLTPQKMTEELETAKSAISFSKQGNKLVSFFLGDKSIKASKKLLEENNIPCFNLI